MANPSIQILTHIKALPDRETELKTLLQQVLEHCCRTTGCSRCVILQHQVYSTDFILLEEWEAGARLQSDLNPQYLDQIFQQGAVLLAEPPTTNWYEMV